MKLRKYTSDDCPTLAGLFFGTVHTVNAKDYSKAQLDAWATGEIDLSAWDKSFLQHNTIIAEIGGEIVGFGDMDNLGYLDRLYVHKDYPHLHIGENLLKKLEQDAISLGVKDFSVHASITALPFFCHMGYKKVMENKVVRGNISLTNFTMEKHISI